MQIWHFSLQIKKTGSDHGQGHTVRSRLRPSDISSQNEENVGSSQRVGNVKTWGMAWK